MPETGKAKFDQTEYNRKYRKVRRGRSRHSPRKAAKAAADLRAEGKPVKLAHDYRYFCGTLYEMPLETPTQDLIDAAAHAVQHATSVRKRHARSSKRGTRQREIDIKLALDRLATAMKPIRKRIAKMPYHTNIKDGDKLREASLAIQKERRKLWKMKKKVHTE